MGLVLGADAGTCILNRDADKTGILLKYSSSQSDPSPFWGEFEGVIEQVEQNLTNSVGVGQNTGKITAGVSGERYLLLRSRGIESPNELREDGLQIHRLRLEMQLAGISPAAVQEVIDHLVELPDIAECNLKVILLLLGDFTRQPIPKNGCELMDGGQRRPELMGDVGKNPVFHDQLLFPQLVQLGVSSGQIFGVRTDGLQRVS